MPKKYAKSTVTTTVPEHFYKQPNSTKWSVRLVPSSDLRALGAKEFRKSTGQSDLKKAKLVGQTLIADKLREWDKLQRQSPSIELRTSSPTVLHAELIEQICAARLYSWLQSDEEERLQGLTEEELQEYAEFASLSDTYMRSILAQGPQSKHWSDVVSDVLEWCDVLGYQIESSDPNLPKLIRDFAAIERKAQNVIRGRNDGEYIPSPPPLQISSRLSDVIEPFLEYKSVKAEEKYVGTMLHAWKKLIEFTGDSPLGRVSPDVLYNFFQSLMTAPDKPWSEKRVSTFGKRVIKEFYSVARTRGLYDGPNPVEQLLILPSNSKEDELKHKRPRLPYNFEKINQIFSSAWYDPKDTTHFRGKMRKDLGARYWIPIIGLLYGSRVREPLQLVCSDIKQLNDLHVISIQTELEDGDDESSSLPKKARSLKNESAKRLLPLHPILIDLGFLPFVEERVKQSGQGALLFPSSEPAPNVKNYKLGRAFEQSFLRFVRDTLKFGYGYGNHSFRHFFEDLIRDCQATKGLWPTGMDQQLSGRKRTRNLDRDFTMKQGSEALYGNGYTVKAMLPYYLRLDFSNVNFPAPYSKWLNS